MSTTHFIKLSQQLEGESALWALLTVNEYFGPENMLGKAMRTKAKPNLRAGSAAEQELHEKVLAGSKAADLSTEELQLAKGVAMAVTSKRNYQLVLPSRTKRSRASELKRDIRRATASRRRIAVNAF